ncbi:MAG: DUF3343 domain-containing protein [Nitrospiraceae bacterium]|nr:DUF3343 domain-containing protein [Nitrospiraceae bacterium]
MEKNFSIVLFNTTSSAIRSEILIKKRTDIKVKLIPVPRHLSSDCGICLSFESGDKEKIQELLLEGNIEFEGIYKV